MNERPTVEDIEALRTRIFNACLKIVGSREDAQDLSSEAIIKAVTNIGKFRGESTLYTWLYKILLNLCRNYLDNVNAHNKRIELTSYDEASEANLLLRDILPDDVWSTDPMILLERKETRLLVLKALTQEHDKETQGGELLVAFHYLGMTYDEIALMHGMSVQAVKSELFRTRQRIKVRLSSRYPTGEF